MIDELINERAGTRDLQDSDFAGDGDNTPDHISISSEDDDDNSSKPVVKVAVARSNCTDTAPPRRNACGTNGIELIERLSTAFDPATQKACDEDRANCALHSTQYIALSQQLRDSQANVESLHNQLGEVQNCLHDADHGRDCAELKLEMVQLSSGDRANPRHSKRRHCTPKPKSKLHCKAYYPDGGSVWYVTDNESVECGDAMATPHHRTQRDSGHVLHLSCPCSRSMSPAHLSSRSVGRSASRRHQSPAHCHHHGLSGPASPSNPFNPTTPFHSIRNGPHNIPVRAMPSLNLRMSDFDDKPNPSRATSGTPGPSTTAAAAVSHGGVLEVVVSPHHGPAVSFVISPTHMGSELKDPVW
jgi:hypothetical protein